MNNNENESQENIIECPKCGENFKESSFYRHLKKHHITVKSYILKTKYNGIQPLCGCGCGKQTLWNVGIRDFNVFIHGHGAYGRKKSDEEKRKIGIKNSQNMKRYLSENPEIAKLKSEQLRSGITEETEKRRIEATKLAYANMTSEDKEKFSKHSKVLWEKGILRDAHILATKTFRERSANGEYDFKTRNENVSKAITKMYLENSYIWSKGSHQTIKGGLCYYRSSWEKQLYDILDAHEDVISFESEPFSIKYEFEGDSHRYIPDVLITFKDKIVLCEVKPLAMRLTDKNTAKREAAIKYCNEHGYEYVEWSPGEESLND